MHEGRRNGLAGALLVVVATLLGLAACGGTADDRPESLGPVRSAHVEVPRALRVLDAGGRLWAHVDRYEVFRRVGADLVPLLAGLDGVAAGEALLVVAPGCRIERVAAPARGELVVRLRAGLPVRVKVRWDGRLPEGAELAGVSLRGRKPQREAWAADLPPPRSLGSDVLDDDQPAPSEFTPMRGPDPTVFLYVPEPGTYALQWTVDGGNARSSTQDRLDVDVSEDTPDLTVERPFPSPHLAAQFAATRKRAR